MGLGAIVVLRERQNRCLTAPHALIARPLELVEVLGRTACERIIDQFLAAGVEMVTVLAASRMSDGIPALNRTSRKVAFRTGGDANAMVGRAATQYAQNGIEHAFVVSSGMYLETDLRDFFYFHREARQSVTRARDGEGVLDLWMIECAIAGQADMPNLLAAQEGRASYAVAGYMCRLTHPRDLRRFASDALVGRCAIRPSGVEVKPGVWMEEGADVDRRARIVAPAYIGRASKVQEDTLITRCSSIERDCYVDYGTVVEDSSILANTHIGIWLDVCHAVASENKMLSLKHEAMLEVSDQNIMRANHSVQKQAVSFGTEQQGEDQEIASDLQPEGSPAPEAWQLGANPAGGD